MTQLVNVVFNIKYYCNTVLFCTNILAAALRYQNLATVYCLMGDFQIAESLVQKSSEICRCISDAKGLSFTYFIHGVLAGLQGQMITAYKFLKECVGPWDKGKFVFPINILVLCSLM